MYKACLWQQTGQCSDYLVSLITCRQEEASQNTLRAYSPNYACMSPCMKDLVWMVSFHGLIQHHEGLEVFSAGCTRCTSPRNTPETPRIIRLSNLSSIALLLLRIVASTTPIHCNQSVERWPPAIGSRNWCQSLSRCMARQVLREPGDSWLILLWCSKLMSKLSPIVNQWLTD